MIQSFHFHGDPIKNISLSSTMEKYGYLSIKLDKKMQFQFI